MSDVILDKIRKLLAKAEDPACPPPEADACVTKAAHLMAKYGIDQAMAAAGGKGPAIVVGDRKVTCDAPYAYDKAYLMICICNAIGVKHVLLNGRDGGGRVMHLFGTTGDLDRAEVLFTSLLVQQARALGRENPPRSGVKAWKRSWMRHYANRIAARLREREQYARREAEAERTGGPSVALVLSDNGALVDQRMREVYPKLRNIGFNVGRSGRGGAAAADRADLGGARVGRTMGAIGN